MKQKGGKKIVDTPLHRAARTGDISRVIQRLYVGDYIDMGNNDGLTPLHQAVYNNMEEMVDFLLNRGSNVNRRNNVGLPPLHYS